MGPGLGRQTMQLARAEGRTVAKLRCGGHWAEAWHKGTATKRIALILRRHSPDKEVLGVVGVPLPGLRCAVIIEAKITLNVGWLMQSPHPSVQTTAPLEALDRPMC